MNKSCQISQISAQLVNPRMTGKDFLWWQNQIFILLYTTREKTSIMMCVCVCVSSWYLQSPSHRLLMLRCKWTTTEVVSPRKQKCNWGDRWRLISPIKSWWFSGWVERRRPDVNFLVSKLEFTVQIKTRKIAFTQPSNFTHTQLTNYCYIMIEMLAYYVLCSTYILPIFI